ncbi:MAG: hypothetical protein SGBAC_006043 [Bacillariaceae sp.]
MKTSLFLFLVATLLAGHDAQTTVDKTKGRLEEKLNTYTGPPGDLKCALINVVVDESRAYDGEDAYLRDIALPEIVRCLLTEEYGYDHVLICGNSFAGDGQFRVKYESFGCAEFDATGAMAPTRLPAGAPQPDPLQFNSDATFEPNDTRGYNAIERSVENVKATINEVDLVVECGRLDKSMILLTDADRDPGNNAPLEGLKTSLTDKNYVSQLMLSVNIGPNDPTNLGVVIEGDGSDNTVFVDVVGDDGFGTNNKLEAYDSFITDVDGMDVTTEYVPLVVGGGGAVWHLASLHAGLGRDSPADADLLNSFTSAFVGTVANKMQCGSYSCGLSHGDGDPHFSTWRSEHFEYHGQCDLVMLKDPDFADGLGLHVHIRTRIVRYWSYIKTVAIRIGDDVLEIEGSSDAADAQPHYWINFEYQGDLEEIAGFPVTQQLPSVYKHVYKIDLDKKYKGHYVLVKIFREFLKVEFFGGAAAYGKTVGILGDYFTGKTLARDGMTVLHDFEELGDEWQVLPSEPKLFREVGQPQYPELCIHPEDPQGERRRRLAESNISMEQAEEACATLKDPLDLKDCVYDVLATQDKDIVGAF